ncbi:MAG: MBL fold metallo-hydrolase [Planctomycetes bacterium]|nr:MBL fold metallo-hydrolase [Planctomycetota bacterium]MCL4729480.1 MBL fold metallo-hydrolase [Planctomycetota bacterium]
MRVIVLGTGQDGGLPQFGARIAPDMQARHDPLAVRLGPSLCVLDADGRCLLVDASPDIKEQETRLLQLPAYAARELGNPFDAVLLTHAHMGHYVGLAHFGREAASTRELPVYATPSMCDFLCRNAPWDQLVGLKNIALREAVDGAVLHPWPGLKLRVFAVPHRGEYTDTLGVSINDRLLYVPDIDGWRQWPNARAEAERHRVCLLDATFFSPEELPGRNLKEISHPFVTDTLKFFDGLQWGRRMVLTHFNHSNPVCDPASPQAQAVLRAGFELAQEMQSFEL